MNVRDTLSRGVTPMCQLWYTHLLNMVKKSQTIKRVRFGHEYMWKTLCIFDLEVISGSWMCATQCFVVIHQCAKYGKPMSNQKCYGPDTNLHTDRRMNRQTEKDRQTEWVQFIPLNFVHRGGRDNKTSSIYDYNMAKPLHKNPCLGGFEIYNFNSIQLLTGFEDFSSFVWPENGSVARSRRLRATDLFEGQTKLMWSEEPVYNCFVIHLHFFFSKFSYSLFPLTYPLDVFNILVRQVRESGRHFDIVTSISRDLLNQ